MCVDYSTGMLVPGSIESVTINIRTTVPGTRYLYVHTGALNGVPAPYLQVEVILLKLNI